MTRARLNCLAAGAFLVAAAWLGAARGDDFGPGLGEIDGSAPEPVATVTDEPYSEVSCTGTNPAYVSDILQLATDSRETLAPLLKLGPEWRYPVHITVVDPDPVTGTGVGESTSVLTDGKTLRIEAFVPANDLNAQEFVQRQFVTALLWEKFFSPTATFDAQTRLDVVPLWLVEGLREWLNDDPERNREEIAKRAALARRAPTLAEIVSWKDLSEDRLLGLWQRAFCFYLVESLVNKPERRADFQQWLGSVTGKSTLSPTWLFPTEMGWQRELLQASTRSRGLVFTWDESAAELTAAETIALPKGKNGTDTRLCTLETISTFPRSPQIDAAIERKILELTSLQLRVHPEWQPIFQLYRFGLTSLIRDKDSAKAVQLLRAANQRRVAEVNFHSQLLDYANWFEVTQNMPIEASHFRSYFRTARELDQAQADPLHPNPLRSDLLKVEAKF